LSAPLGAAVWWITAVEPAFQAAFDTVALFPHFTDTVALLLFAVTVKVPDPDGPVSHTRTIVSGPAANGVVSTANAVAEIATAPAPASSTAAADFKIPIVILLSEQSIRLSGQNARGQSPVTQTASRSYETG
jgi:hypothetical protein